MSGLVCLLISEVYCIRSRGNIYRFELPHYGGPYLVGKSGCVLKNQPGERHPFWYGFQLWIDQGKKLDSNGNCLWQHAPEPILKHRGGNNYDIVGYKPPRPGETV